MNRVSFFIDGFNSYHAIEEVPRYHKYKWLDYWRLAEAIVPRTKKIVAVNYFTAYRTWKQDSYNRHKLYVEALRSRGVNVVLGRFKNVTRRCKVCGEISRKYHEEKQTDVNIALSLLRDALLGEFDEGILLTNDTDLIPAIREVRNSNVAAQVGVLFPVGRRSEELKQEADFSIRMKEYHLSSCQLPEVLDVRGTKILRPPGWT